jgi:predicted nucleotidyltransferase
MMGAEEKDYANILARYFSTPERVGLVSAYLFGSQCTGRTHRESDVDVGVLLDWQTHPARRSRFEELLKLSSDLIAALGTNKVDVVILNDTPPQLAARIVTEGKQLLCSDPLLDRAFFRDVQLRAADLVAFLSRTRRLKLLALQR